MCALGEHFRRYAHALRFAISQHGTQKFHPVVKYKHYQISSRARASLSIPLWAPHEFSFDQVNGIFLSYIKSTICINYYSLTSQVAIFINISIHIGVLRGDKNCIFFQNFCINYKMFSKNF